MEAILTVGQHMPRKLLARSNCKMQLQQITTTTSQTKGVRRSTCTTHEKYY